MFDRITKTANKGLNWIACATAAVMVLLVCCDIVLRYSGHPIKGSNDLVSIISLVMIAFAIGYTQVQKRHIAVVFILERFSTRIQRVITRFTSILSLGLFIILTWQSCALARRIWLSGEVSTTLRFPIYPFVYALALGCFFMCLAITADIINSWRKRD